MIGQCVARKADRSSHRTKSNSTAERRSSTACLDPQVRTDEDLMRAFATGENEALGEVYNRWYVDLYAMFRHLNWQHADAQDLVHETFLKLIKCRNERST